LKSAVFFSFVLLISKNRFSSQGMHLTSGARGEIGGKGAKFHLWLNIWDCCPGCFYN